MSKALTLAAVGDVAPIRPFAPQGAHAEMWKRFGSAGLSMINLEVPLTTRQHGSYKAFNIKAEPGVARSLRSLGVDHATVANNHTVDFGHAGLMETIEALKQAQIGVCGGGSDLDEALRIDVGAYGGLNIGIMGLSAALPVGYGASLGSPGVGPLRVDTRFFIDHVTLSECPGMSPWVETTVLKEDLDKVLEVIGKSRSRVDFLIVQIHWGVPHGWAPAYRGPLADYQRPLAHALIDAGVDLIVGHHPHVFHGVEKYGKGVIAYSLGHFLFHVFGNTAKLDLTASYPPYSTESLRTGEGRDTLLLEADVADGRLKEVRFIPVRLDDAGEPYVLTGSEAQTVIARLQNYSRPLDTSLGFVNGEGVLRM